MKGNIARAAALSADDAVEYYSPGRRRDYRRIRVTFAEVAELADAHGSGPCTRKGVGVRVPSSAPFLATNFYKVAIPILILFSVRRPVMLVKGSVALHHGWKLV